MFSRQYVFSKVRDTEKYDLPTLLKDDVFCLLCNEVLFHVHILDDLTNIYESRNEGTSAGRIRRACSTQTDESAFETILFRILLLTDEVCTYVCMYMFSLLDAKEQLVDDDGIKRYQGTNYYEFVQMSFIFCTWFHDEDCVCNGFGILFHRLLILECFSSSIKCSSDIIINDMTNTLAQNLYLYLCNVDDFYFSVHTLSLSLVKVGCRKIVLFCNNRLIWMCNFYFSCFI